VHHWIEPLVQVVSEVPQLFPWPLFRLIQEREGQLSGQVRPRPGKTRFRAERSHTRPQKHGWAESSNAYKGRGYLPLSWDVQLSCIVAGFLKRSLVVVYRLPFQ